VQPRTAADGDVADAGGGERRDPRQRQRLAGADEDVAAPEVLASLPDVAPRVDGLERDHLAVADLRDLDGEHRIRAARDRGAGGDRRRRAGRHRSAGVLAGRDVGEQPQRRPVGGVGRVHREAVHGRAVERREVDRGHGRLGGHAPGGGGERHPLDGQRLGRGEHQPQRLLDRDHPPAPGPLIPRCATSSGPAARTRGR
jgi:hypothetical protein